MAEPSDICAVILAAGASRRFGDEDKLTAMLHGKMLGLHVSDKLAAIGFARKYVVAASADHPCTAGWKVDGCEVVINPDAAQGLGTSAALAAKLAMECQADALLICLADMPFIPNAHMRDMIDHFEDGCLATSGSDHASPPAIFGLEFLAGMRDLDGDTGARQLLQNARLIDLEDHFLVDIDDPGTLEHFNSNRAG